ncbi:MAG: helix-turn-helix domain-containing protein [Chlamydiales bacterium]
MSFISTPFGEQEFYLSQPFFRSKFFDPLLFTTLCELFNISREAGYKWVNRYKNEGFDGLKDRPRKPHKNSRAIHPDIVSS